MLLRAFVIVAIVTLQTVFAPVPALAKTWDKTWNDDITMHITYGNVSADLRAAESEAERLARDQRRPVEVSLFLISSIGMGAYCIYKARRICRAYSQSHLEHITTSWYRHMRARFQAEYKGEDKPMAEAVGDTMLSEDVHPLVLGWALTGGLLAYSAIVSTLARLSTLGVVEITSACAASLEQYSGMGFLDSSHGNADQGEWMLIFHKERFGLVSDPLDREVLNMFETFADTVARHESITSKRVLIDEGQGDIFLLSDLRRINVWHAFTYLEQLRNLRATIRETCHKQGLDNDQATVNQRRHLMVLGILYACVLALGTATVLMDGSVTAFASPFLALIVFSSLLDDYRFITPLSKEAVQLRSELGRLRLCLHDTDGGCGEMNEGLGTQAWRLILTRALVLGEDEKAADRMRQCASPLTHNASIQAMLKWCGSPSRGMTWAFEDATSFATPHARTARSEPRPSY